MYYSNIVKNIKAHDIRFTKGVLQHLQIVMQQIVTSQQFMAMEKPHKLLDSDIFLLGHGEHFPFVLWLCFDLWGIDTTNCHKAVEGQAMTGTTCHCRCVHRIPV